MKKLIALILVLVLTLGLVACGSSEDAGEADAPAAEETKGAVQTAGKFSVFVPEGYVLAAGAITGGDDENQCYIQGETPDMFDYIWIIVKRDEDDAASSVALTKEVNEAEDITVAAATTWLGCHYTYDRPSGSVDCGAITANVGGVVYQVNFCGHAPDSAEMKAVLDSLSFS